MTAFTKFRVPSAALLGGLMLAGCAGLPAPGDRDLAGAIEPSLRAAAAAAEGAGDYKGAVQHWRTLYQRNPRDKGVALALARVLRYSGMAQQGADVMQAQLTLTPGDAELLAELGKAYLAADRIALALKALDEARAAQPSRWDVHSAMGVALDTLGRPAEAEAAYRRALELAPDNPAVMNNLGLSQALAGRLDDALATLTRAADHPRAGAQIRQNLALVLALKGDGAGAEKLARRDLPPDLARTNADILRALAAGAVGE